MRGALALDGLLERVAAIGEPHALLFGLARLSAPLGHCEKHASSSCVYE